MQKKIEKNLFCFWYNCIWIGFVNLSLLRREKLWLGVNVFTNSLKILHITKRGFFQLNCLHIDQKIWETCCGSDLNSVWTRLPCCFSKGLQRPDFLDIYLTTVFPVCNFENAAAMRVIYFFKIFKISGAFQKHRKKFEKKFSLLENIASQLANSSCLY